MSDDFQSHELVTATKLNRALRSGRCIGRARRITSSTTSSSTTLVPVLRLDDIPLTAGRQYTIVSSALALDGSVAADSITIVMTYTVDGSTPTIASPTFPGSNVQIVQSNVSIPEYRSIITTYIPAADETLSLLLCVFRGSGSGVVGILADGTTRICEFRVLDQGEDPGDTGVDL